MMILAIDSGKTFLKLGIYNQNEVLKRFQVTYNHIDDILLKVTTEFDIDNIVLSIVGHFDKSYLEKYFPKTKTIFINHNCLFPFENTYETPQTLGIDRMVLSAGAVLSYPNKNRMIIDMGSCITYDFINDKNQYLGGAISPGVDMRLKTLNEKTASLPLIEAKTFDEVIGKSTKTAILSGVMTAILFEMEGFINYFRKENDNFIIILTGGSSIFFVKPLKSLIFAEPNFLMDSLVKLFIYQTKQ